MACTNLPKSINAPATSADGVVHIVCKFHEALGGDRFRLYFGAADATEGTAVASVQLGRREVRMK